MTGDRSLRHRLWDILDAIALIGRALDGVDMAAHRRSAEKRAAVERWIMIISEASRHLPDDLKSLHPEIAWRDLADAATCGMSKIRSGPNGRGR